MPHQFSRQPKPGLLFRMVRGESCGATSPSAKQIDGDNLMQRIVVILVSAEPLAIFGLAIFFSFLGFEDLAVAAQTFSQDTYREQARSSSLDDHEKIQRFIGQFNADSFQLRNRASQEVLRFGPTAINSLASATLHDDPEVRFRAFEALKHLALRGDDDTILRIESVLNELSDHSSPAVANAAQNRLQQLAIDLERVITARFIALGAKVDASYDTFSEVPPRGLVIDSNWQGSSQDLQLVRRLSSINSLEIKSEKMDELVLRSIIELEHLTSLKLETSNLGNHAIPILLHSKSLQSLELRYLPIDDSVVDLLIAAENLRKLTLVGTRISDDGWVELSSSISSDRLDFRRGGFLGLRTMVTESPCIITDVIGDSAAAEAGFHVGDRIVDFNGELIDNGQEFISAVSKCYVGDRVKITVIRSGSEELVFEVTLGRWNM
ncbi:MAG TPA: PDZ domain-containing protein [Pirellulaceae bacterium]|nr:PDZ domain-containing protein [Pirellulaceae bacterium]HMP68822.1 PDZ domain-containing protein [Pirellulaceae bacterium]